MQEGKVQYFGTGFSDDDYRNVREHFERIVEPDKDVRPLTFRYDSAVVQVSEMGYRAGDFYRAISIEIDAPDSTAVFNAFAREMPEIAILMERSSKTGYPFANLDKKHLGTLVTMPEPELARTR